MGDSERVSRPGRVHADDDGLRSAAVAAGRPHVALLCASTVDEWHRSLGPAAPDTCHFVSVDDAVRGATAANGTGRAVGGGMYVSVLERPVPDPSPVLADAFEGTSGGSLVVDDLSFLLQDADEAATALERLRTVATDASAELHVRLPDDAEAATTVARHFTPVDDATARVVASEGLSYLREADPTNFGYLRRHWEEARAGLEAVEMTYPQAKQVHAALPESETTPRTLGAALGGLVELGALDVWGDTVAANRYDLTAYDPERVAAIGDVIDSLDD